MQSDKTQLDGQITQLQDQLDQKVWELNYRDKSTLREQFIQISGGSMRITREQLRELCDQLAIVYSEEKHTKLARHLSAHQAGHMIGFEVFHSWLKSRDRKKRSH
jgi:hypothetical protein